MPNRALRGNVAVAVYCYVNSCGYYGDVPAVAHENAPFKMVYIILLLFAPFVKKKFIGFQLILRPGHGTIRQDTPEGERGTL